MEEEENMLSLRVANEHPNVLFLGAHCDDIEIGCGATILKLKKELRADFSVKWIVFASNSIRANETKKSSSAFLDGVKSKEVVILGHRDGFLQAKWEKIKEWFEEEKSRFDPDMIFTHYRYDLHQDHRLINELTWNTYRNHLILEYEIPKYDGDLGPPNFYVPVGEEIVDEKSRIIFESFHSQDGKAWFTPDAIKGLMRVRGLETNQPERFAEAFYARKVVF